MFEKEIKFIADFNLNMVKSYGSFITFEKLRGSSMHPAVIQYISAELDYLVSEDRKRLLQDSVFDYSGTETAKYFGFIAQEVKKSKKISYEDLKKLVIQAVSFNLNFLARPKWSLSKLIYNDEQNKSIEEIKLNLNYIYFYDYIKSIFLSYISIRRLTALSVTEFELIINKLDYELFGTQPKKLVDYSLYSIAEFFNMGEVSKTRVPLSALELFLKEKNQMDYLFRLKKVFPEILNQKLEIEEAKKIIYSAAPIESKPVETKEARVEEHEAGQLPVQTLNLQDEMPEAEISADNIQGLLTDENEKFDFNEEFADDKKEDEIKTDDIMENVNDPAEEDPLIFEHENEEKIDTSFFNDDNLTTEPELPVENQTEDMPEIPDVQEKIDIPEASNQPETPLSGTMSNDDFFSMFSEEVKKIEENNKDLGQLAGTDEPEPVKKNDADTFFDFEQEADNLLKAFKDTVDEINSKELDFIDDTATGTDKAAEDLLKNFHGGMEESSSDKKDEGDLSSEPIAFKPAARRKRDILDSMSQNDIEKIISNVFNDDNKDFVDTMEKLNECANYDEATEILKSVFVTYRVNPYTKDALTLTNSVANYFTQV